MRAMTIRFSHRAFNTTNDISSPPTQQIVRSAPALRCRRVVVSAYLESGVRCAGEMSAREQEPATGERSTTRERVLNRG